LHSELKRASRKIIAAALVLRSADAPNGQVRVVSFIYGHGGGSESITFVLFFVNDVVVIVRTAMHCVHCGNEIPEKHGFCSKCGKQIGVAKPSVRTGFVVALLVVFFVGFGLVLYFIRADNATAKIQPPNPNAPQIRMYTESIDKVFTVPKLSHKAFRFTIPGGATDGVLAGHFAATGGAHNDIEVWLMNADDFANWQNRHPVMAIYNSGQVTQGTLNVSLPQAGTYYLVFNNRFSLISPKAIEDDVTLTYKH
jgi:predicted nucleic acid-binding Zn ribbon protein